jgi:predicted nucleotidyltransferase
MSAVGGAGQRVLLKELGARDVRFVLVGGLAVAAHGYVRATADVDIVFSTDPESCDRFASVLKELGSEVAFADRPQQSGGITGSWLAGGGHFRFATEAGPLDALSTLAGFDYERLAAAAIVIEFDGAGVMICSLDDLIAIKASGDRARDRSDIEELRRLHGD